MRTPGDRSARCPAGTRCRWAALLALAVLFPTPLSGQADGPSDRTSWSVGVELGTLPHRSDLFLSVRAEPIRRSGVGFSFLWSWHPPATSAEGPDGLFELGLAYRTRLNRSAVLIPRISVSALGDGGGGGLAFTAGPGVGAGLVVPAGRVGFRIDYSVRYFIEPLGVYDGGLAHGVALSVALGGWRP